MYLYTKLYFSTAHLLLHAIPSASILYILDIMYNYEFGQGRIISFGGLIIPRCACTSKVYGGSVCVCVCVRRYKREGMETRSTCDSYRLVEVFLRIPLLPRGARLVREH